MYSQGSNSLCPNLCVRVQFRFCNLNSHLKNLHPEHPRLPPASKHSQRSRKEWHAVDGRSHMWSEHFFTRRLSEGMAGSRGSRTLRPTLGELSHSPLLLAVSSHRHVIQRAHTHTRFQNSTYYYRTISAGQKSRHSMMGSAGLLPHLGPGPLPSSLVAGNPPPGNTGLSPHSPPLTAQDQSQLPELACSARPCGPTVRSQLSTSLRGSGSIPAFLFCSQLRKLSAFQGPAW